MYEQQDVRIERGAETAAALPVAPAPSRRVTGEPPFVVVFGEPAALERPHGAAAILRRAGAVVVTVEPSSDVDTAPRERSGSWGNPPPVLLIEAVEAPRVARAAARWLEQGSALDGLPTLAVLTLRQLGVFEASSFDDFVLHPYQPEELLMRIHALQRRETGTKATRVQRLGQLRLDGKRRDVTLHGRSVHLTAKEFDLLARFCALRDRVHTRRDLLTHVWGGRYLGSSRTVDIHVRRLRVKLGDAFPLETVRGAGYRLAAPAPSFADGSAP